MKSIAKDVKSPHKILFTGTSAAQDQTFAVGNYKLLPNIIGSGTETAAPQAVPSAMQRLLSHYSTLTSVTAEDIINQQKGGIQVK